MTQWHGGVKEERRDEKKDRKRERAGQREGDNERDRENEREGQREKDRGTERESERGWGREQRIERGTERERGRDRKREGETERVMNRERDRGEVRKPLRGDAGKMECFESHLRAGLANALCADGTDSCGGKLAFARVSMLLLTLSPTLKDTTRNCSRVSPSRSSKSTRIGSRVSASSQTI